MENESRKGRAPLKVSIDGVQWCWRDCEKYPDRSEYLYYFYWWNWLTKENRYWGYEHMYYDGNHHSFGFWFINWSWNRVPSWWPKRRTKG